MLLLVHRDDELRYLVDRRHPRAALRYFHHGDPSKSLRYRVPQQMAGLQRPTLLVDLHGLRFQ